MWIVTVSVMACSFLYRSGGAQFETWQRKLYEKDVKYEDSACKSEDSEVVAAFFRERPLSRLIGICHNDCPIIKCRPLIHFPSLAKHARVSGVVPVHILVDEGGKVLYARVLGGHPLLRASARRAACETQFKNYPHHKRQGVLHLTFDSRDVYIGIPTTANQVL